MGVRLMARAVRATLVALVMWLGLMPVATARSAEWGPYPTGTVVALHGTPHLWIADKRGVLHWAGDTRALVGRDVDWAKRIEVLFGQLQQQARGDPWLSAGLLQDGAAIYLVKWEADASLPRLLHIQSIADMELFGINSDNYGSLVYDQGAWQQRFGLAVDRLQRAELPQVTAPVGEWGTLGSDPGQLDHPQGVAVDEQGNVYVADTWNNRVQKFSPTGLPLAQWGTEGSGPGQFRGPRGLTVDGQGNVYVADYWNHRIQKLAPTGLPLAQWGTFGNDPGQFDHPEGVAVDGQGNVYVADYWNHRIQKLAPTGQPLARWGQRGGGPGQFERPKDVAVDGQGNIYVADHGNRRIQVLSPLGQPVGQWQTEALPTAVAVDTQGNVYVADAEDHRIQRFSPTGRLLGQWGGSFLARTGKGPGQFSQPSSLAVDGQGSVYVANFGSHRIVRVPPTALR